MGEIQVVRDGVYAIKNVGNNEYLNVVGNGSNVTFWDNVRTNGGSNPGSSETKLSCDLLAVASCVRAWEIKLIRDDIYNVKILNSDMYVNVLGGWREPGTNVHMWDNWYSNHSQWQILKAQDATDDSNQAPKAKAEADQKA